MSYIRGPTIGRIVLTKLDDYIYSNGEEIVCYGKSDAALIEILWRRWDTDDEILKQWLIRSLADRLKVPLRSTPLTNEEWDKEYKELFDAEVARFK